MTPRSVRFAGALVTAATTLLAASARAQTPVPTPRPRPCQEPERRQFDFWVGQWEVRNPAGQVAGHNRIEAILGGCALQESWTGAQGGFSGYSYNSWNPMTKGWHQTWVDVSGTLLLLDGGLVDGKMVMRGESAGPSGKAVNEITWEPLPGGKVRQVWRVSNDAGKTWTVAFDGTYTKKG
jgi:hypothetical protein